MIVDTSVWIEYFAATGSAADKWLTTRIATERDIVIPEVVLMELLIGTTDESKAAVHRRRLQKFSVEPLAPLRDIEDAAAIHRKCRRRGHTIRSLIDCQVAAMALRLGLAVAHRDRDFETIAADCGLRTEPLF
jgi:predicted nucleic acid-binding protein